MNTYLSALSSISVLVLLISFIALLRHFKVLKQEDGALFSKIVTQITLPAVVFSVLSHSKALEWEYGVVIIFIFFSEMVVLLIAWFIGKKLKISSAELGTLMIVSAFGSSALLGYALVGQVFPSNIEALSEAVLISELGVGVGLFTIGTMVAIYFGRSATQIQTPLQSIAIFSKSPLFLSIIAGLGYSILGLPTQLPVVKEIFEVIALVSKANTFFVALTVGVLLRFSGIASILPLVIVAIILKLFISPLLVWLPSLGMGLSSLQLEVAVLESAMPSAMLSVVLAAKYGCDAQLASKLVFITTILSIISVTTIVGIF